MSIAEAGSKRNLEAIALLALFLSFSSFSFYNLVTKPVACYGGDIGTSKCPFPTTPGTWCGHPPVGVPNICHVYTWSPFPNDVSFRPTTGLFNNDTSYYFAYNMTGFSAFSLCVTTPPGQQIEDGNTTLTLQFQNASDSNWWNVDSSSTHSGGSIGLLTVAGTYCSLTLGVFNFNTLFSECIQPGLSQCNLRIGGNTPMTGCSVFPNCFTLISNIFLQFYTIGQTIQTFISCDRTSGTTSTATVNCGRSIYQNQGSQAITVSWRATNATGSGCGTTGQNCWRTGSNTCTIGAGNPTCSTTLTFSPAFTGSENVILNWSPFSALTFTTSAPPSIVTVLA